MRLRSKYTLRALMDQEGVSLSALAGAVHVHRSFISHLVSGRALGCSRATAERIAGVLAVPVDVLFQVDDCVGRRPAVQARLDGTNAPVALTRDSQSDNDPG